MQAIGELGEQGARAGKCAGGERRPGDETDIPALAGSQHVLAAAIDEIVAVLHRGHGKVGTGRLDVLDRDVAEADMADQAIATHLGDGPELFVAGNARIEAMELPQIDAVEAQAAQTHQGALAQVFGTSDGFQNAGAETGQTTFGRDRQSAVGVKRLADQCLADERP